MEMIMQCDIIAQSPGKGTVQFVQNDKDGKPVANVIINFIDPKEVRQFEHLKNYAISIVDEQAS